MNGYCDIVIMGDGFGNSNEAKFRKYAELVKQNLLKREPFTTRHNVLRFWVINSKSPLGCTTTGGMETALICDTNKIKKALGSTPMNIIHILSWKNGYGGANGQVSVTGLNQANDTNAQCPFESRAFDGISIHEIGHTLGCEHVFNAFGGHVMWYATNGGCEIAGKPFLPEHQTIINKFIDKAITT